MFLKKLIFCFLLISFALFSKSSLAESICSKDGYTILTINGVFTSEFDARKNMQNLKDLEEFLRPREKINFEYLLNPSHLGGLGDIAVATYQKYFEGETVSDYDLVEMHQDASEKVKTQKVLLVAHSQGNFYANSLYDTLAGKIGGVPTQSIGVYGVATPASRVAGDGKWLTSSTDKVIMGLVGNISPRGVMTANTNISLSPGDDKLGHKFSEVYLKYRGGKIVYDIQESLDKLRENNVQTESAACISPPERTIAHRALGATLAVLDPVAGITFGTVKTTLVATYSIARAVTDTVGEMGVYIAQLIKNEPTIASVAVPDVSLGAVTEPILLSEENITSGEEIILEREPSITQEPKVEEKFIIQDSNFVSSSPKPPDPFTGFSGFSAGFGGGSAPVQNVITVIPPPDTPNVTTPTNLSQTFSTTSISFSGTTTPGAVASLYINGVFSTSTSADSSGAWASSLVLAQGTQLISFYANNSSGTSSPLQASISVDSSVPTISSFSVNNCVRSYCGFYASSTPTLSFAWSGSSTGSTFELFENNSSLGQTTATTSILTRDSGTRSYELRLYSSAGVYSSTSTQVVISQSPYPISFKCSYILSGAVEGVTYAMLGPDQCLFELLNLSASGEFMAFFMSGIPGNGSLIYTPYLGTIPRSLSGFPMSINEYTRLSSTTPVDYFAGVVRGNNFTELTDFTKYLQGIKSYFPNTDFGIVRFKLTGPN